MAVDRGPVMRRKKKKNVIIDVMLPSPCCGNTCSCAIDARSHGAPRVWLWPSMLEEKGKYSCNNQRAPRGSQSFSPFSTSLSPPSLLARPPMFRFLVVLLAVVAALAGLAGAQVCGIKGVEGATAQIGLQLQPPPPRAAFPPPIWAHAPTLG